jgi:hypothetical protein
MRYFAGFEVDPEIEVVPTNRPSSAQNPIHSSASGGWRTELQLRGDQDSQLTYDRFRHTIEIH